jgi:hypothetical protein
VLSVRERPSPWRRCPICHDDVAAPSCLCSRCRTEFHEDCRLALGRCSTLACLGTIDLRIRVRARARKAVRVARALALVGLPVLVMLAVPITGALLDARKAGNEVSMGGALRTVQREHLDHPEWGADVPDLFRFP